MGQSQSMQLDMDQPAVATSETVLGQQAVKVKVRGTPDRAR